MGGIESWRGSGPAGSHVTDKQRPVLHVATTMMKREPIADKRVALFLSRSCSSASGPISLMSTCSSVPPTAPSTASETAPEGGHVMEEKRNCLLQSKMFTRFLGAELL